MNRTQFFKKLATAVKAPFAAAMLLTCLSVEANSNARTPFTKIKHIENWGGNDHNGLFVKTTEKTISNPANCEYEWDYIIEPHVSETSRAMLLAAYSADLSVRFVIYGKGCTDNRPIIVAVRLERG